MRIAQVLAGIAACALTCSGSSNAQELVGMAPDPDAEYSPYLQHDYPDQVLFGDTHLHTAYSVDAGFIGASKTPDDAYRFAKPRLFRTVTSCSATSCFKPGFARLVQRALTLPP